MMSGERRLSEISLHWHEEKSAFRRTAKPVASEIHSLARSSLVWSKVCARTHARPPTLLFSTCELREKQERRASEGRSLRGEIFPSHPSTQPFFFSQQKRRELTVPAAHMLLHHMWSRKDNQMKPFPFIERKRRQVRVQLLCSISKNLFSRFIFLLLFAYSFSDETRVWRTPAQIASAWEADERPREERKQPLREAAEDTE